MSKEDMVKEAVEEAKKLRSSRSRDRKQNRNLKKKQKEEAD
ncbi:MAG: hypothetical protein ACLS9B_06785 [Coprococcus comes]